MTPEEAKTNPAGSGENAAVPQTNPDSAVRSFDMKRDMAGLNANPPAAADGGLKEEVLAKLGKNGLVALIVVAVLLVVTAACLALRQDKSANPASDLGIEANLEADGAETATAYPADPELTPLDNLPPVTSDLAPYQNANDAVRVSNLTALANLAAVYSLDQKADLPISKDYIRLDQDNPVSSFLKDAIGKYGKESSLLLDPLAPDFYLAYRSLDGKNIEFSARMEDTGAAYCAEQQVCLYHKALTEEDLGAIGANLELYK